MMAVFLPLVSLASSLAGATSAAPVCSALEDAEGRLPPNVHRLAAGREGGGYWKIATELAERFNATQSADKGAVLCIQQGGSCDNIRKLLDGEVGFALVQYDVAAEAHIAGQQASKNNGGTTHPQTSGGWMCGLSAARAAQRELQLVAGVAEEALHFFVRRPRFITDLTDLVGDEIYLGRPGGGSFETSKALLGTAGHALRDFSAFEGSQSSALRAISEPAASLEAIFAADVPGDSDFDQLLRDGFASLVPLPERNFNIILEQYERHYRVCNITNRDYPVLSRAEIPTLCVSTVLLTSAPHQTLMGPDPKDAATSDLLAVLTRLNDPSSHIRPSWDGFAEDAADGIALHPLASRLVEEAEQQATLVILTVVALGIVLALSAISLVQRRRSRRGLQRSTATQAVRPIFPLTAFFILIVICTVLVLDLEHEINPNLRTYESAFWSMAMFATGNFDDSTLKSSGARIIGFISTVLGLGVLAWFTASLTALLTGGNQVRWKALQDHLVIINFREAYLPMVRTLLSPGPASTPDLHIVVPDGLSPRVETHLRSLKGVWTHRLNPEDPFELAQLRPTDARRIVILDAGDGHAQAPHPIRIVRAIRHIATTAPPARRRVFGRLQTSERAEAVEALGRFRHKESPDHKKPWVLIEASERVLATPDANLGKRAITISPRELLLRWVGTCVLEPAFDSTFLSLMSFQDNNDEIYVLPCPHWAVGQTWRAFRRRIFQGEGAAAQILPVTVWRMGDPDRPSPGQFGAVPVCPPLDLALEASDWLLFIAENETDLRAAMAGLTKQRTRS